MEESLNSNLREDGKEEPPPLPPPPFSSPLPPCKFPYPSTLVAVIIVGQEGGNVDSKRGDRRVSSSARIRDTDTEAVLLWGRGGERGMSTEGRARRGALR